jgi:hypothetical protein
MICNEGIKKGKCTGSKMRWAEGKTCRASRTEFIPKIPDAVVGDAKGGSAV